MIALCWFGVFVGLQADIWAFRHGSTLLVIATTAATILVLSGLGYVTRRGASLETARQAAEERQFAMRIDPPLLSLRTPE